MAEVSETVSPYILEPCQFRAPEFPMRVRGRCRPGGKRAPAALPAVPALSGAVAEARARWAPDNSGARRSLPEKVLQTAWRNAGSQMITVRGTDGLRYRVMYPGRPGGSAGPDFVDAVLEREDGTRLHGDVEVHVRSADWRRHGHAADSRYNGVVLHVAAEGGGEKTLTRAGVTVPLLLLDRKRIDELQAQPRSVAPEGVEHLPLPFLDLAAAGDERFRNKSEGIGYLIRAASADQALWQCALETLGYPNNKKGFRQLATSMPWETARARADRGSMPVIESVLMWAAGFGDRPGGEPAPQARRPEWSVRAGRPANHPKRRLPAAAAWAVAWSARGGPAAVFEQSVREAAGPDALPAVFLTGQPAGGASAVGPARAADGVVNVVLPSVYALALSRGDTGLARRAFDLYRSFPKLQENAVTREAALLAAGRGISGKAGTAREQQGLIHLYRLMTGAVVPHRQLPLM
ncbi:MAG TPA: DUF2851 family protein [bacterium]